MTKRKRHCSYFCDGYCFLNGDTGEVCDTNDNLHDGFCPAAESDRELEEHVDALIADLERVQKVQAAELLLKLTDYHYRSWYLNDGSVFIFELGICSFKLNAFTRVAAKVNELREKGYEVYAITHESTSFGECYSFLIVPDCPEDWDKLLRPGADGATLVYAYVWNTTHEECSESGYIAVKFENCMLRRVG